MCENEFSREERTVSIPFEPLAELLSRWEHDHAPTVDPREWAAEVTDVDLDLATSWPDEPTLRECPHPYVYPAGRQDDGAGGWLDLVTCCQCGSTVVQS